MLDFKNLKDFAEASYKTHQTRILRIGKYEDVYKMNWDFKPPEGDIIEPLPSPEPHNAIKGLTRLIIASEPAIIPYTDSPDDSYAETAELIARAMLEQANRRGPWMLAYDMALSSVLWGECYVRVANAADNMKYFENRGDKRMQERYRRIGMERPFLFRVYHAGMVIPEYSELGLESMTVRRVIPIRWAKAWWGDAAVERAVRSVDTAGQDTVVVWEVDSYEQFATWVDGADTPIRNDENTLGFLPWAGSIVEGSGLFVAPEDQRLPVLYPVVESGYWHAQSYADSVIYSLAMNLGKYPMGIANLENPSRPVRDLVDWSTPMGIIRLGLSEKFDVLSKKIIDDSIMTSKNISDSRMAEMMIPKQVLGQAPDKVMAYSSLNLLVQAGRLPLVPTQRMLGVIMGQLLEIPFMWAKATNEKYLIHSPRLTPSGEPLVIDPGAYKNVRFEVNIHAQFGEDDASRVMVAASAVNAGLWSRERAIEYTGVHTPKDEAAKVRRDLRDMAEFQAVTTAQAQTTAQAIAMAGMAAHPPGSQVAPQAVNYRPAEDFVRMCGNCAFFRGPGQPCAVVAYPIDPTYTCDAWMLMPQQSQNAMGGGPGTPPGPTPMTPVAPPGMMNPNTAQGGAGIPPIGPMGPTTTREQVTGRDVSGAPTAAPLGLPMR